MNSTPLLLAALCALALQPLAFARRPGAAPTPPMGWNSWNWHGKQAINERIVEQTIDAMVESGLRDAGYTYVVVDGGWRDTKLGSRGELVPHPQKFPGGMKRLADYAHARGLKFGLHCVPGTHDCGGDAVGAFGREELHVRQFVEWGVDFVKVDKCRLESGWDEAQLKRVYTKWADLLSASGRDIVFSISAYTFRDWYPETCHMARTTPDIRARHHQGGAVFEPPRSPAELRAIETDPAYRPGFGESTVEGSLLSVMAVAELNNAHAAAAGRGYWNDPDMVVVGEQGLTLSEQQAHFALWCVMSSPLMLGNDPRNLTAAEKEIILNRECIAVNQDPTEQGRRVRRNGLTEVWVKRLQGGRAAVLLLNRHPQEPRSITIRGDELGFARGFKARDLFAKQDLVVSGPAVTRSIAPHGCLFLLLSPSTR